MKRLKVVRVYKSMRSGGGVHARLLDLLPRLAEHADVRLLCYRSPGDRADELRARGVAVDLVPLGVKWSPRTLGRLSRYFREHRPDVVHTHEYTANTVAIVAAERAGVPVRVRHLHTLAPWGWGGPVRTRLRIWTDRRAARRSQLTLAVSEAVRREYLRGTRLPSASCRVLYNGVDAARFRDCRELGRAVRAELEIDPEAPVAGIVGRLSLGKGHPEFLRTARRLADRVPGARFLVVGDGGQRPSLEEQAAQLGLGERVRFTGQRSDVPAVLGAMDLFLFTSMPARRGRIQDGLPGVVIEAQLAGLPVVGFDLPMMGELVTSGSGALVPIGDEEALARRALSFLLDPGGRMRAAAEARRSGERFSLDRSVEATLTTYEELLCRVPAGRGASA